MNQKQRIEKLMEKHNIATQMELHIKILKNLGKEKPYVKAEKDKGNFSKMINGERDFNKDYIIPLESILETSLNYIINGDKFNPNFDNFGIKYVAFSNKYEDFEKLDNLSEEGNNPLLNVDEFGKNIIDYIIQYDSINGLRYLSDTYNLQFNSFNNCISLKNLFINEEKTEKILSLICKDDDFKLFNSIFDGFYSIDNFQYYNKDSHFYFKESFKKLISKTTNILKGLLVERKMKLKHSDNDYLFTNPLINNVLDYMLTNSQNYKTQILNVLEYTKYFNQKQLNLFQKEHGLNLELEIDENGFIVNNRMFYGNIIVMPEVFNPKINKEIKTLIEEIQKINKEITINERYDFFGKKIYKTDENYIYKKHSNNVTEYELYKDFKDSDLQGILKYHSTEFDIDKFKKINNTHQVNSNMINKNQLKNLSKFLREFHYECKLKLNNNVYINNNLTSENILFNGDDLAAIVDWSRCEISDNGLSDFLFLVTEWSGISDTFVENKNKFENIKIMFREYFIEDKCGDFGNRLEKYLLAKKESLSKEEIIYEKISWALVFVDIYKEKLNQL